MKSRDLVLRLILVVLAGVAVWLVFVRRATSFVVRDHYTSSEPGALRVLFIGNSHTFVNDLPTTFAKLVHAKDPARGLAITDVTLGGATLEDHLNDGTAAKTIRRASWDYVVLQEQSTVVGTQPAAYERAARRLDDVIRAAHAKTVIYALWPRRGGDPLTLEAEYEHVAQELGALLVRVGPAWERALARDPKLALYQTDGNHAAKAGTYLAACVFYEALVGHTENLPTAELVSPEIAAELQRAASSE